jgi:hypothetical protein
VNRPEGERPPRKPRRRWEDNIKKGSSRLGVERQELDCSDSRQEQVAGACECGYESLH